jgi:hypothetical protein
MGELATEQATAVFEEESREELIKANVGVVGKVAKKVLLFGAVGHSLFASDNLSHTYGLVGMRLNFGGSQPPAEPVANNDSADLMERTRL